jgi:hypothetical protein
MKLGPAEGASGLSSAVVSRSESSQSINQISGCQMIVPKLQEFCARDDGTPGPLEMPFPRPHRGCGKGSVNKGSEDVPCWRWSINARKKCCAKWHLCFPCASQWRDGKRDFVGMMAN